MTEIERPFPFELISQPGDSNRTHKTREQRNHGCFKDGHLASTVPQAADEAPQMLSCEF